MRRILSLSVPLMLGVLLIFGMFAAAHAQGAVSPVTQATTATSTGWDLVQQFGPIWGGMLLLYGLMYQVVKAGFVKKLAGNRLAGVVALIGVFGAMLEAHFGSGSWAGVVVTAIAAIKMLVSPTVTPDPTKTGPMIPKTTIASVLIGAVLLGGTLMASCGGAGGTGPVTPIVNGTIDCTIDNGGQIATLLASLRPKPGQGIDWHEVYLKAKAAGGAVGGCVIAQLAQEYLTSGTYAATNGSNSWDGYAALEKFRMEEVHGATFHTVHGDL